MVELQVSISEVDIQLTDLANALFLFIGLYKYNYMIDTCRVSSVRCVAVLFIAPYPYLLHSSKVSCLKMPLVSVIMCASRRAIKCAPCRDVSRHICETIIHHSLPFI